MKKIKVLILIALVLSITSCANQNSKNVQDEQSDFSLIDRKMSFTKDEPYEDFFNFEYSGDITNQTKNIYKQATIRMLLEFTLENGQVLKDVDMAAGKEVFGAAEASDLVEMFQPNQVYNLKNLKTESISESYVKYPIKSVTLTFTIELTDEINDEKDETTIKSEDITSEWTKAVQGTFGKDFDKEEN